MPQTRRAPFPLLALLPESLRGVVLNFHWDPDRLHALHLPEREVPLANLAWHLELPFWATDGRPFQVSPAEVAADPGRYRDQWQRTLASDLHYPLDCYVSATGRLTVLDGVHRLLKASLAGQQTVRIRTLAEADFDDIAVRH